MGPRLLAVDDDVDFLTVLASWFCNRGFEVASAGDAVEAVGHMGGGRFDVAIINLQLPGISGLQLQTLFRAHDPSMPVIFVSGHGTMDDAIAALREGRAFDFLRKPLASLQHLGLVVEKALLARQQATNTGPLPPPAQRPTFVPALPDGASTLSSRELEIVAALSEGLSNRVIADRLCVSEKTVKNHLSQIFSKLGVENRTQAALFAAEIKRRIGPVA